MEILKINPKNLNNALSEAKEAIEKGKIILCPTDTVYGLICDAQNKKAVNRIFKIKKRPAGKPIPVFVKDIRMAKELAHIDKKLEAALKKVWPGKTTVILKSKKTIPGVTLRRTIGLRLPKYKFLNQLLLKVKRPIAQTSANISGKSASTKIKEAFSQFKKMPNKKSGGLPDLILDAGNLKLSLPSTIIDLSSRKVKILRKGATNPKLIKL